MSIVAERIQARLEALDLTPRAASLRAGRQPFTVRDILSGKNVNPKADLILDLARALACSTDYLLGLAAEPGAAPPGHGIDPELIEVLQRTPKADQDLVRRMLQGVAESGATYRAPKPKKKRAAKKRAHS